MILAAIVETSGMTPLWTAWFLENQSRSHNTAAKIWKKCESAQIIPKELVGVKMPSIQSVRLRARLVCGIGILLEKGIGITRNRKCWNGISIPIL